MLAQTLPSIFENVVIAIVGLQLDVFTFGTGFDQRILSDSSILVQKTAAITYPADET